MSVPIVTICPHSMNDSSGLLKKEPFICRSIITIDVMIPSFSLITKSSINPNFSLVCIITTSFLFNSDYVTIVPPPYSMYMFQKKKFEQKKEADCFFVYFLVDYSNIS